MADSLTLIDMFVRGIAVGAVVVTGLGVWRSGVGRPAQAATIMVSLSIAAWLVTESHILWAAFDRPYAVVLPAYAVGGLFWLFVLTVFEDRPLSWANFSPTLILIVSGVICELLPDPAKTWVWAGRNIFSGLLCLHAGLVIARGWNGDLLEGRRRLRGLVLGFAAAFGVLTVALSFTARLDPSGPWMAFTTGGPYGGAILTALIVTLAAVFLQARPAVFGASRRAGQGADGRAEAAERLLLDKLNALMAADGWRREGLTIGAMAGQLGEPEHRLRRLINQRLGHRNFADFVNGYRIEAAKRRLADPAEARTTVAAIAFDLGYGSLGPFNRAFRAATGATPTDWRRDALAEVSPELKEAS